MEKTNFELEMILPEEKKKIEIGNLHLFWDNLLSSFFYSSFLEESIGSFASLRYKGFF